MGGVLSRSKCFRRRRRNAISILVFWKMRVWSSLGQRRKLGAQTMEMFSRPIFVFLMFSGLIKFWRGDRGILQEWKNHFYEDVGMSSCKTRGTRRCLHRDRKSFIIHSLHLCVFKSFASHECTSIQTIDAYINCSS